MTTKRLNLQEMNTLREVISKQRLSLLPIIDSIGFIPLTTEQREELRVVLSDELVQTGLMENDEPNERGLLIENLIDRLGHF